MRSYLLAAVAVLSAATASASTRNHSYITYDGGDNSVIVQRDDRRELDARTNMPVFPGDEIRTGRRGRIEVRLSDGNIVAIDRNSAVEFKSIVDSYDGASERTALETRYGTVMLQRLTGSRTPVRVDSEVASYVLSRESIVSLESAGRDGDVLSVYEGSVEIRTEEGTDRARAGEELRIDSEGIYASNAVVDDGTTDFERWFMRRSGRYRSTTSRYLDSRLAYADSDFDSHGSWVYVSDYSSWVWRPRVSVGWRPYHHGYWRHSPGGSLVWVSDEPWGWVPYHYGRWAWSTSYGWIWLPGSGYSPAWVYWAYGPSYVGWVPAGWYDCYRPYYDWAYRPYARSGADIAIGFNGRVRLGDVDLRGWTFLDSKQIVSTRADRAALTVDLVKNRLSREGGEAYVSGSPARFTREQLKNPESAVGVIARGGSGGGTGKGSSGSPAADLTSFFRRDPELPTTVRDRIARPRAEGGSTTPRTAGGVTTRGTIPAAPAAGDSGVIRRGGASGSVGSEGGVVRRGGETGRVSGETINVTPRSNDGSTITRPRRGEEGSETWRAPRVQRGGGDDMPAPSTAPADGSIRRRGVRVDRPAAESDSWRSAPRESESGSDDGAIRRRSSGRESVAPARGESDDTPRRVIDRIGGSIRVTPSTRESSANNNDRPRQERAERPRSERVERPRSSSSSSDSSRARKSEPAKESSSSNIKPE